MRTVASGYEKITADRASFFAHSQNLSFQLRGTGQYRLTEPFAIQRMGDPLGADVAEGPIQQQTASVVIIAAPLANELSYDSSLPLVQSGNISHDQTPD